MTNDSKRWRYTFLVSTTTTKKRRKTRKRANGMAYARIWLLSIYVCGPVGPVGPVGNIQDYDITNTGHFPPQLIHSRYFSQSRTINLSHEKKKYGSFFAYTFVSLIQK